MFRHLTDNDPRPHFFHQSNLADYNPALPGTASRPGRDPLPGHRHARRALRGRVRRATRRWCSSRRRRSPRRSRVRRLGARGAGVSAWLQDGRVYVQNTARRRSRSRSPGPPRASSTAASAPAGSRSPRARRPSTCRPIRRTRARRSITGTARVGEKLEASNGPGPARPRSATRASGSAATPAARCENIAGATGGELRADRGRRGQDAAGRRARRQLDLVGQPGVLGADRRGRPKPVAASARRQEATTPGGGDPKGADAAGGRVSRRGADAGSAKLRLTKVKLSPRRFAVAHRRRPRARGSTARGSRGGSTARRPCG